MWQIVGKGAFGKTCNSKTQTNGFVPKLRVSVNANSKSTFRIENTHFNSKSAFINIQRKFSTEESTGSIEVADKLKSETDFRQFIKEGDKIAVGVSGGVDSLITSCILKEGGYDIFGVHMINWDKENDETFGVTSIQGQCSEKDEEDAKRICEILVIPYSRVSFVKEYWNEVWSSTLKDYQKGLTPNPDVLCNSNIKAKHFLKYAKQNLQCNLIATGHHARKRLITIENDDDYYYYDDPNYVKPEKQEESETGTPKRQLWQLIRGFDKKKDQSYFLSTLVQAQIARLIFPIGNWVKNNIKVQAHLLNFDFITKKKESMGVCFIGKRKGNFSAFLSQYINQSPGPMVFFGNNVIAGHHKGIAQFTIGQRVTLFKSTVEPVYCIHKDPKSNIVFVAEGYYHPAHYSMALYTTPNFNWIAGFPPSILTKGGVFECEAKVRYSVGTVPCKVQLLEGKSLLSENCPFISFLKTKPNEPILKISFNDGVHSITPGQVVVLYKGEICLGGGEIHCGDGHYYAKYFDSYGNFLDKDHLIDPTELAKKKKEKKISGWNYFKKRPKYNLTGQNNDQQ